MSIILKLAVKAVAYVTVTAAVGRIFRKSVISSVIEDVGDKIQELTYDLSDKFR